MSKLSNFISENWTFMSGVAGVAALSGAMGHAVSTFHNPEVTETHYAVLASRQQEMKDVMKHVKRDFDKMSVLIDEATANGDNLSDVKDRIGEIAYSAEAKILDVLDIEDTSTVDFENISVRDRVLDFSKHARLAESAVEALVDIEESLVNGDIENVRIAFDDLKDTINQSDKAQNATVSL